MRTAAVFGALLAPAAFAAPAPAPVPSVSSEGYIDESILDTRGALAGGILQSDVLASAAAVNQQIYQAVTDPKQWLKCNAFNMVYRREW